MERVANGFKEAVAGVVIGVVVQAFINVFSKMPMIPPQYIFMLQLIQVVGIIADFFIILFAPSFGLGFQWLGIRYGLHGIFGIDRIMVNNSIYNCCSSYVFLRLWLNSSNGD